MVLCVSCLDAHRQPAREFEAAQATKERRGRVSEDKSGRNAMWALMKGAMQHGLMCVIVGRPRGVGARAEGA